MTFVFGFLASKYPRMLKIIHFRKSKSNFGESGNRTCHLLTRSNSVTTVICMTSHKNHNMVFMWGTRSTCLDELIYIHKRRKTKGNRGNSLPTPSEKFVMKNDVFSISRQNFAFFLRNIHSPKFDLDLRPCLYSIIFIAKLPSRAKNFSFWYAVGSIQKI